jgi:transcription elongation factor Elf1|tara:strand:+ start:156 stop:1142 length:987 start_codon:yes stop_codon:yes gene_type:complete
MDFIDIKYINLISSRFQKFKKVKPYLYNLRCPICGDSQKNKNKARGYLYRIKNNTNYKCHNCGVNMSFNNFLKQIDPESHKQYVFEKFKDGHAGKNFQTEEPEDIFKKLSKKPVFKKTVIDLPSAFDVDKSRAYLNARAIFDGKFYYAKNFQEFANLIKPNSFQNTKFGEERIVIPLVRDEKLIGVQGRALSTNPVKYLTIMLEEDAPKIYGLDRIDKNSRVYITEGPFDSTFLCNAVAMCGADLVQRDWGISNYCWIFDNEPRSREIAKRIHSAIDRGEEVVIWPENVVEKDINDMVLAGHYVQDLVESNRYSGLKAKIKFNTWKKI